MTDWLPKVTRYLAGYLAGTKPITIVVLVVGSQCSVYERHTHFESQICLVEVTHGTQLQHNESGHKSKISLHI